MSQHRLRYTRILELWSVVVFYSVATCIVVYLCGQNIGIRDWCRAFMPITLDTYWFFTQYVLLFASIPLLNFILDKCPFEHWRRGIIIAFLLLGLWQFVARRDIFHTNYGYSALFFAYLYLLAGGIRKHGIFSNAKWYWLALSFFGASLASVLYTYIQFSLGIVVKASGYNSPFILIEAISLFLLLKDLNIKSQCSQSLVARYVAPSVFSVYIIHSNPIFRRLVGWDDYWMSLLLKNVNIGGGVMRVCVTAVLIFSSCIVVDLLRRVTFRGTKLVLEQLRQH